jgi:hypothetical protein
MTGWAHQQVLKLLSLDAINKELILLVRGPPKLNERLLVKEHCKARPLCTGTIFSLRI